MLGPLVSRPPVSTRNAPSWKAHNTKTEKLGSMRDLATTSSGSEQAVSSRGSTFTWLLIASGGHCESDVSRTVQRN